MARRLVELVELTPEDAVVEIGPGTGQLTRAIAAVARRTVAIEVDRGLVELFREQGLPASVELCHGDALKADLGGIARRLGPPVVLVGNLPYGISGRFLGALLGPRNPFRRWAFMLQAEVAARVLAEPGTPEYGPLAAQARLWTDARRVLKLSPEEFEPRPRVRSAFLVFDPAADRPHVTDPALLKAVIRTSFQYRRKTLRAALRGRVAGADAGLRRAGLDSGRRAETLSEAEFVALANAIAEVETGE